VTVGESAYWHVARRRWQVIVAFAQLGVGAALVAAEAFNSPRPLRDIIIGLVVGLAIGLIAVRPAEQLAGPPAVAAGRGRHWERRPPEGRHDSRQPTAQRELVVRIAPWPDPELTERPRPTFSPPRR
jgi:hypothetical protein